MNILRAIYGLLSFFRSTLQATKQLLLKCPAIHDN